MSKRSLGPTIGPKSRLGDALVEEFRAILIFEPDSGDRSDLSGCSLAIDTSTRVGQHGWTSILEDPSEMAGDIPGTYDMDRLLRDLPLSQLAKYKVNTRRPPKPKGVKRQ